MYLAPRFDLTTFQYSYLFIIPLGASSKPVSSSCAYNTIGNFITTKFYFSPTYVRIRTTTFLSLRSLDPYILRFVSSLLKLHTHHRYFLDLRHIGNTMHLCTVFHSIICLGCSLPTSAGFKQKDEYTSFCLPQSQGGVSRRYSIIPPLGISVLQS